MKPTLEEVKEHFKDATRVKCVIDGKNVNVQLDSIIVTFDNDFIQSELTDDHAILYSELRGGYAEILETKSTTPERYKTDSIDVIDFCKLYGLNFNLGSIIKYTCRKKDQDIEDLKKIIDFAQREIKHLETFK